VRSEERGVGVGRTLRPTILGWKPKPRGSSTRTPLRELCVSSVASVSKLARLVFRAFSCLFVAEPPIGERQLPWHVNSEP
jgi:hypothetical protein